MKKTASRMQRDFKNVSSTITTDLRFQIQNIAHWSTGAVRVLESQLFRQEEDIQQQQRVEQQSLQVYDTKADNDYFDQLMLKRQLLRE